MRTLRLLAVLAGIIALLLGLAIFGRSYSATHWPIAPGRILSSRVVTTANGGYAPVVEYEYVLAGRVHHGSGIRSPSAGGPPDSSAMSSRESAEAIVARYPVGREMAVGYDPGDPRQSVLQPVLKWWSLSLVLGGAGLLAGGFWLGKVTLRERPRP